VLSKLACLTLCRAIQLLVLLARGSTAKDLEVLVLRHHLAGVPAPAAAGILAGDLLHRRHRLAQRLYILFLHRTRHPPGPPGRVTANP
jgi:hypothetical protein